METVMNTDNEKFLARMIIELNNASSDEIDGDYYDPIDAEDLKRQAAREKKCQEEREKKAEQSRLQEAEALLNCFVNSIAHSSNGEFDDSPADVIQLYVDTDRLDVAAKATRKYFKKYKETV